MKLTFTRIIPIAAVLVFGILWFESDPPPPPSPAFPKPQQARKESGLGNVAAIARRARRSSGPRTEDTEPKNESTTAENLPVKPTANNSPWMQVLRRHADGDKAAFQEFLEAITPDNAMSAWQAARTAKLTAPDRARLYSTLGSVGGGEAIQQMIAAADPNAALAVNGWGQVNPDGALEWFQQLKLNDNEQMQDYLRDSNQSQEAFLDKISDSLLDSLYPTPGADSPEATREAYSAETLRFVESLMEQDRQKGEAAMRELTERLIKLYDGNTLADWVGQMESPSIKSATIQRIIEAGTFSSAPMEAVDWAFSLEEGQSREVGLSAAFGQLGSGAGGVDLVEVANQLNQLPEGRERDFALNGAAHGALGHNPDYALQLANSISDEGFRKVVTETLNRRLASMTTEAGK